MQSLLVAVSIGTDATLILIPLKNHELMTAAAIEPTRTVSFKFRKEDQYKNFGVTDKKCSSIVIDMYFFCFTSLGVCWIDAFKIVTLLMLENW